MVPPYGILTISITVNRADYLKAKEVIQGLNSPSFSQMRMLEELSLVLAQAGISIKLITPSEIKISCLISDAQMKQAVECLHRGFELDQLS